jgi:hypothetical protein
MASDSPLAMPQEQSDYSHFFMLPYIVHFYKWLPTFEERLIQKSGATGMMTVDPDYIINQSKIILYEFMIRKGKTISPRQICIFGLASYMLSFKYHVDYLYDGYISLIIKAGKETFTADQYIATEWDIYETLDFEIVF